MLRDEARVGRTGQQHCALADPERTFDLHAGSVDSCHAAPETRVRRSSTAS